MPALSSIRLPYFIVNAFTSSKSTPTKLGNPAAVFLLEEPISEEQMSAAGVLMQQPMCCFVVPIPGGTKEVKDYKIWWATATGQIVPLCGHGSIATSVLLSSQNPSLRLINYHTQSHGILPSNILSPLYADVTFPLHDTPTSIPEPERSQILECLFKAIPNSKEDDFASISRGKFDTVVEWSDTERPLSSLEVVGEELLTVGARGVCLVSHPPATSATNGEERPDFLVRVFHPKTCVPPEDQVCGSAHSDVLPFFLSKLPSKATGEEWISHHVGSRGGRLGLVPLGEGRFSLRGEGVVDREGEIEI
ncbi:hypothetical protein BDY24DRAFT_395591 [Mrakia frigida]|uniref:PhzF family phenazine biosynthesis protein n=1 Tax=Mrakia frigida TaxID=29902 RepID=UPI003FCC24D5